MYCKNCGNQVDDNAVVCPYCGAGVRNAPVEEKKKPVNGLGIAGFVISILSLWLGMYFCIASILALVLSAVAVALRKKYSVNGLAIAGLVISCITTFIWGIIWIAAASLIASLF